MTGNQGVAPAAQSPGHSGFAPSPVPGLVHSASVPNASRLPWLLDALVNFPANGKPPTEVAFPLLAAGFIKRYETTKPCRECGTPRPDYEYYLITLAGRLFMAAAQWDGSPQGQDREAGLIAEGDDSPVPEGDAPK